MSSNPTQLPNARPLNPAGPAPLRQPGSLRRTSSVDVFFPQGKSGNMRVEGRARDIATLASGGPPIVLAEDRFTAELQPDRIIAAITAEPARPGLARLIGQSGSSWFRARLQEAVPQEKAAGTPLYLILDDMPGATLVFGLGLVAMGSGLAEPGAPGAAGFRVVEEDRQAGRGLHRPCPRLAGAAGG